MKATKQQQETIKEIVLKTLEYYIKKQNKNRSAIIEAIKKDTLNLDLRQIYLDGVSSIKFNDENINVLRLEDGQRLFTHDSSFDYYLGDLNDAHVNTVLNIIRKELILKQKNMKTNTNEEDFGMKSESLFFTYARFKGENNFRLFGLFDSCTYFKKCCAPRYKLKDIEDHKRLAIELVELNKDMDLQIKFVGMNNKILFNTLAL